MKRILLTQNKYTLVDDIDYDDLLQKKWSVLPTPSGKLYAITYNSGKAILMHRYLLKTPKGFDGEHKNGDSLDNRRENLRNATRGQNIANAKLNKRNTSGYKGVSFDKAKKKWKSKIVFNGKSISLGLFHSPQDAALAYKKAAQHYFGIYFNKEFSAS